MKSWEPEQDFGRADFPSRKKSAADPTGKPVPDPRVATPTFRRLDTGGEFAPAAPPEKRSADGPGTPPAPARAAGTKPGSFDPARGLVDLQQRLLIESAVASPERTLRLLRKWYWEKWPTAQGGRATSSIAPFDRIRVVFAAFPERVAIYVLELMSPVERGKFQELLRDTRTYSAATASLACREFMQGLEQETL